LYKTHLSGALSSSGTENVSEAPFQTPKPDLKNVHIDNDNNNGPQICCYTSKLLGTLMNQLGRQR